MNTLWILGDQLSLTNSALAIGDKRQDIILMVESKARGKVLPYHQQKLVLIYSAMRHFAAELKHQGWQVDVKGYLYSAGLNIGFYYNL